MARHWIIGALFLGCVLLGEACKDTEQCVLEERCAEQPAFTYRSLLCQSPYVCCAEVKKDEASACKGTEQCVLQERCAVEAPPFTYRSLSSSCQSPYVCCEEVKKDKGSTEKTGSSEDNECGRSNPNGLDENMEVCEGQTYPGQFPWTIAVFIKGTYIGGGTLVAPGVVLTSAHKLRHVSEADIVVRAGEWDHSTEAEEFSHEESRVKEIVRHEEFNYSTGANNLALLFLETPFEIKDHIRTICLPNEVKSLVGKRCTVAGWGRQSYPVKYNSDILKKIELPMVSRDTCQRQLRNTVMGRTFSLAPSLICAGGELDKDACLGDGGSALFCALEDGSDRYEQVGIVNWGIECGKKDVPATYTNVAMFTDWIDQQLKGHSAQVRQPEVPRFQFRKT